MEEDNIVYHCDENCKNKKYWICPTCETIHVFDTLPYDTFECEICGDLSNVVEEYLKSSIEEACKFNETI